jgi:hypothetical protein
MGQQTASNGAFRPTTRGPAPGGALLTQQKRGPLGVSCIRIGAPKGSGEIALPFAYTGPPHACGAGCLTRYGFAQPQQTSMEAMISRRRADRGDLAVCLVTASQCGLREAIDGPK